MTLLPLLIVQLMTLLPLLIVQHMTLLPLQLWQWQQLLQGLAPLLLHLCRQLWWWACGLRGRVFLRCTCMLWVCQEVRVRSAKEGLQPDRGTGVTAHCSQ